MGDRKQGFLGTPWQKRSDERESASDDGPFRNRRIQLERQRMVRDEQGRRRFHGAFTGGFTAGYYGTVDTAEGFRPKSYISHRSKAGSSRDHGFSQDLHRPEDYMDEEDFSEFGIAPKKVRLDNDYSQNKFSRYRVAANHDKPIRSTTSIGEKILKRLRGWNLITNLADLRNIRKDDYHGLGYQGLKASTSSVSTFSNPLIARMKDKRIEISGQAFGEGVLEEDDIDTYAIDEYGIDHISNYELPAYQSESSDKIKSKKERYDLQQGINDITDIQIPGFARALQKNSTNDNEHDVTFRLPDVPNDWKLPVRPASSLDSLSEPSGSDLHIKLQERSKNLCDIFTSSGSTPAISTGASVRSGLLSFGDLKSQDTREEVKATFVLPAETDQQPVVHRQMVEWHPCSLLCKHFDVPNPYPANEYSGVKSKDLSVDDDHDRFDEPATDSGLLAPLDFRKSVFNVFFDDNANATSAEFLSSDDELPQVVTIEDPELMAKIVDETRQTTPSQNSPGQYSDIIVCDELRPEPELIVLSSSSSSPRSPHASKKAENLQDSHDSDEYGPPLPPTFSKLPKHQVSIPGRPARHSSKSKRHKKHKKKN